MRRASAQRCSLHLALPLAILLAVPLASPAKLDLANFATLRCIGLGRWRCAPALFLAEDFGGGPVLPVPVPQDAVMAVEMALAPQKKAAMLEVLLHGRTIVNRDDGVFDNLPWGWAASPQAKRDAFSRFTGRGYPREGYGSPFHMLLDMIRRDAKADVAEVVVENTALLGNLVLGGALLLERRVGDASDDSGARAMGAGAAPARDARWWAGGDAPSVPDAFPADGPAFSLSQEPELCECTGDEALGLAIALNCVVRVETAVWEAAAIDAKYSMQRGKMRVEVEPTPEVKPKRPFWSTALEKEEEEARRRGPPEVPLPWEIRSAGAIGFPRSLALPPHILPLSSSM